MREDSGAYTQFFFNEARHRFIVTGGDPTLILTLIHALKLILTLIFFRISSRKRIFVYLSTFSILMLFIVLGVGLCLEEVARDHWNKTVHESRIRKKITRFVAALSVSQKPEWWVRKLVTNLALITFLAFPRFCSYFSLCCGRASFMPYLIVWTFISPNNCNHV